MGYRRPILVSLGTAALAAAVAQTVVLPIVPEIQRHHEVSSTVATFAVTSFLLTSAVATPIIGRLGDMFGKQRMLLITLALFAAGALTIAAIDSIFAVIGGRAIQGLGAGVFPLAFGIIRDELPPAQVGRGVGLVNAIFGAGTAIGVAGTGFMAEHFGYQSTFVVTFALTTLAIPLAWRFVPASPTRDPARIDWLGAGLMAVGLGLVLVGISRAGATGWASRETLGLVLGGAAVLALWVRQARGTPQPMVDMKLMAQRTVASANATALLVGFGLLSTYVLVPQLAQLPPETGFGFGVSASESGLFLVPSAIAMVLGSTLAGRLGDAHGARLPLLIGLSLAISAFTLMLVLHANRTALYGIMVVNGLGVGFSFAALAQLIVEGVGATQTGVAAATNTIARFIGGALGAQMAASLVAASAVAGSALPQESGFVTAFAISIVASICALAVAIFAVPRRRGPGGRRGEPAEVGRIDPLA